MHAEHTESFPMNFDIAEIRKLSVAARVQLVEDIWDSIAADTSGVAPDVTPEQLAELERRHAAYQADPQRAIPWAEVQQALRANMAHRR